MKEWFSPAEFAAFRLPFMPTTKARINQMADRDGWRRPDLEWPANPAGVWRRREGRGGGYEYRIAVLDSTAQAALLRKLAAQAPVETSVPDAARAELARAAVWEVYERAPERLKEKARHRLQAVQAAQRMVDEGRPRDITMMQVSRMFGVSESTLWNWRRACYGRPTQDWLAHLVPAYVGRQAKAECTPDAWKHVMSDYLRPEQPPFTDCYRRLAAVAAERGWTIPSERTLARWMDEVPETTKVLGRRGAEALQRMYPAQERDKSALLPMEAVNADGHRFDVFVAWPGEKAPVRPVLVVWQDIYSGKILSWRLDRSENAHAVLLALGDMVETWGVPEHAVLDNGRNFASKWLTGGVSNRYRFKVKADEPHGVLTTLQCQVHWATPYHGQAKPIERAFRDLASTIARDPRFSGAWTGNTIANKPANYGSAAVPLDLFERVVAEGIAEHNARTGRRSKVANGRSFDETFLAAYAEAMPRRVNEAQRRLWLLAAEGVVVRKQDGSIHLMGNRYHHDALYDHRGQKVIVRFDPDKLHDDVHVYRLNGSFICTAECLAAEGFLDVTAAREHAARRKAWLKAQKAMLEAERPMPLAEVAAALDQISRPASEAAPQTKIVRPVFRARGAAAAAVVAEEMEASGTLVAFGRGLQALKNSGGGDD